MDFLENSIKGGDKRGSIEVITGSMFSGKTEELIRRLRRAQFAGLRVEVCNTLANNGVRVIVAGLDMDFMGNPFGPVPGLLSIAEYIKKVHAICVKCGNLAQYSFRKSEEAAVVLPGEKDKYEPLCRNCYNNALIKT